ncbi:SusC/RagA family TonB-linked outer membrane protein [Pararcticibacter amylolyticus]|nr:TonB-dependent receptor [Pararcticibacter amylolyticus]
MKITGIIILALTLEASASSFAQNVSITVTNANLKNVFKEVRKQTGYDFIYNNEVLERANPVTVKVVKQDLKVLLADIFRNQPLTYIVEDKAIVVNVKTNGAASFVKDRVITGTVVSEDDGIPLPGVSVKVKGAARGVTTNANGYYSISVPGDGSVLQFAYVGFKTKEIAVSSGSEFNVKLSVENNELNEVVVQAYGTIRRGALTNSVSTIAAKDFEKRPITNVNTALAGAAPGIQTNSGSGQPGTGPAIRIRGFGSITAGMEPLYILDGAPYDGVLNNINPNDIESISVLKDASAAALYGSRGANGVIIITTKKGLKNSDRLEAKVSSGITSRALASYEKVDAFQYYPLMWESMRNQLVASGKTVTEANQLATNGIKTNLVYNPFNVADNDIVRTDGTMNPDAKLLYADDLNWREPMQQTGLRQDYSLGLNGGTEKSTYYVSLNYLDDKGYSKQTAFNRITGRAKIDAQPKKWFKSGVNIAGTISKTDLANEDAGLNENPFYVDLLMGPIYPVYQHDPSTGEFLYDDKGEKMYDDGEFRPIYQGRNILAETSYNKLYNKRNALNGRGYAEVSFLKNFKLTFNAAVDLNNYEYLFYRNRIIGDGKSLNGRTSRTDTKSQYTNFNQLLNYNKKEGKHEFDFLAGHENYRYLYHNLNAQRQNQILDGNVELENYTNPATAGSYVEEYKTEGYFSRVQYSFGDRYFGSASYRRDASSKFYDKVRWGNFWSAGAGWNIHNEEFFRVKWIDHLKLRTAYGDLGSDAIPGYYLWQSFYNIGENNNTEPGITRNRVAGNKELAWEHNTSLDAALEYGLFNSRVNGSFEFFHRKSDALLFSVPLPLSSGMTSQPRNIGSMYNRGWEVELRADAIKKKDFNWNIALNWTKFKNRITKLPSEQIIDGTKNRMVGRSVYDYWLRDFYGVDPQTGRELYTANPALEDAAAFTNDRGDQVTTDANSALYHFAGTAIADYYGSLGNTFSYKSFSLNFLFMFQVGGKAFDSDYQSLMYNGTYGRALHKDALKRWQNEGDVTDVPVRNTGTTMYDSDRWLIDATALSLRSASLTYTLPKTFASRMKISRAQAYLTGENLFIVSKRKGLDPTQSFTGVSSYTYAPTRIVTLGINLSL